MKRILVTGTTGQIGSELIPALRKRYGADNVVAAGHKRKLSVKLAESGPFCYLDVTDFEEIEKTVKGYNIGTIYHLASILSAVAETNPQVAWNVNMKGLTTVLEIARKYSCSIFFPSSIGAFGFSTPPENTPQDTIQRPTTMYGVTKVSGELLCDYYFKRFGIDARGIRYPGLISFETLPGGGTTDYAVDIFYGALQKKRYECFLKKGTRLDMMYMPDAVRAAIELMEANSEDLKHRNAFNVAAMSFSPEDIYAAIKELIPNFTMTYKVDPVRQAIADSWPNKMDDSTARKEWGWRPQYDLPAMTMEMVNQVGQKLKV